MALLTRSTVISTASASAPAGMSSVNKPSPLVIEPPSNPTDFMAVFFELLPLHEAMSPIISIVKVKRRVVEIIGFIFPFSYLGVDSPG